MNALPLNALQLPLLAAPAVGLGSLVLLRKLRSLQWILFFLAAALFAGAAALLYGRWGLVTRLDLGVATLTFRNAPLGWLFFAFSSGLTLLIAVFSLSFNDRKHASGVAPLWTILLAAAMGIFFAGDWIAFLVAWEVMGWTSFFIIANGREKSFKASLYYYTLSLVGTAALLAAVFVTYRATGTLDLDGSLAALAALWPTQPGTVGGVAALLAVTFFAKSALGPFFMWPAKAHAEAPDDFSSYLSGVMIKFGVFGLVRILLPLFGPSYSGALVAGTPAFLWVLGWLGALTAVWGTLLAVRENDMKRLMAYSTVSNMGYIMVALSVNTIFGVAAALFHVFNHMIFKGSIFLSLAAVKFRTGEREMHKLGGMAYRMPVTFFAFLIGIIAAAGIPPMSGFASKWMVFQSLFSRRMLLMAVPVLFASTASFMYLYRGLHSIFLGQLSPRFQKVRAAPAPQMLAMILLMLGVVAVGFFPGLALNPVRDALAGLEGTIGTPLVPHALSGGAAAALSGLPAPSAPGLAALPTTLTTITGVTAKINLTAVGLAFLGAFFGVLVLYILGKRRRHVEWLDTYTSGEDPAEWGMTPEQYHYAYHFYEPFEKLVNPLLDRFSMERLFAAVSRGFRRLAGSVARAFNGEGAGVGLALLALVAILAVGVAVWRF